MERSEKPGTETARTTGGAAPRPVSGEIDSRIREFTAQAKRFSENFLEAAGPEFTRDPVHSSVVNVELAKSLFSKWVIEILLTLYARSEIGFQELRRALRSISPRVLSQKLRLLEERRLVRRTVLSTRPTRVHYALTDDGLVLASLGEPIFLFLRHRQPVDRTRPGRPRRAPAVRPKAAGRRRDA